MRNILIDSSVWIEYFNGSEKVIALHELIDKNLICVNDLIFTELIPFLKQKRQNKLINILNSVKKINIDINWQEIINYQVINLKNGINKVSISDLIIIQNVLMNDLELFSLDKHFIIMQKLFKYKMYSNF